jgi:hypothetical protein
LVQSLKLNWLNHSKLTQDEKDDSNNDQNMDPISGFREIGAEPPAENAEQPQHYKYDDNCPHDISPFA